MHVIAVQSTIHPHKKKVARNKHDGTMNESRLLRTVDSYLSRKTTAAFHAFNTDAPFSPDRYKEFVNVSRLNNSFFFIRMTWHLTNRKRISNKEYNLFESFSVIFQK